MKKVIYTTIVGAYDGLLEQPRYKGWDYICFSDQTSLGWRSKLGLSGWKILPFKNDDFDNTRYSRMPKLLPHRYLAEYDYSVYIDGNAKLQNNPDELLDLMDWPDFMAAYHPFRDNLFDEFDECAKLGMDSDAVFSQQCKKYKNAGLPDPSQLIENNFLLRRHMSEDVQKIHENWWQELCTESRRDQLSLPFVCWQNNYSPVLMTQDLKKQFFKTKAHYRSPFEKLVRSIKKRLG